MKAALAALTLMVQEASQYQIVLTHLLLQMMAQEIIV
jgi:hypothetical protein